MDGTDVSLVFNSFMIVDLKRYELENKKSLNLNSLDYLALMNIAQYIHRWKEERNYKTLLKKYHLNQMKLEENDDMKLIKQ